MSDFVKIKNRIHWIDILKGIGIFFVVMGHTFKDNSIYYWIYSFHMPLFFLISGFLIEPQKTLTSYKEFTLKKCKSLLWPFIFFRIILIIYWLIIECHFRDLDLGPIWFLIVLFFDEIIITPILLKYRKTWHSILAMIICSITFLLFNNIDFSIFSNYPLWALFRTIPGWTLRILNAGIWFSGGFLLHKVIRVLPKNSIYIYTTLIISLCISITLFKFNPESSMYCNITGNFGLYLILAFSGIIFTFLMCRYIIKQNKYIEWIGKYTLIILAIHEPIKRIILKISSIITNINIDFLQNNILSGFIISFLVLISCIPIIILLKKIRNHTGKIGSIILSFVK